MTQSALRHHHYYFSFRPLPIIAGSTRSTCLKISTRHSFALPAGASVLLVLCFSCSSFFFPNFNFGMDGMGIRLRDPAWRSLVCLPISILYDVRLTPDSHTLSCPRHLLQMVPRLAQKLLRGCRLDRTHRYGHIAFFVAICRRLYLFELRAEEVWT